MSKLIDQYKTIKQPSEGLYKEKGSKFISLAYPVSSEKDIKPILDNLRNQYHDARHHCYAYLIGYENEIYRINDDGEPSSSAGKPILGQIKSHSLTNILIVVIRYFGGTLLGVGGLINAYKTAAADAIENAKIITVKLADYYRIYFNYPEMNDVMRILKEENTIQINQKFDLSCMIEVKLERNTSKKALDRLKIIKDVNIDFTGTK